MAVLNKFGSDPGAIVTTVIIGPILAPPNNTIDVSEFGATLREALPGETTTVSLQGSTDNFVLSIVELDRIEMPQNGLVQKSYESPPRIIPGQSFRVVFIQTAARPVSALILGETTGADIKDLP